MQFIDLLELHGEHDLELIKSVLNEKKIVYRIKNQFYDNPAKNYVEYINFDGSIGYPTLQVDEAKLKEAQKELTSAGIKIHIDSINDEFGLVKWIDQVFGDLGILNWIHKPYRIVFAILFIPICIGIYLLSLVLFDFSDITKEDLIYKQWCIAKAESNGQSINLDKTEFPKFLDIKIPNFGCENRISFSENNIDIKLNKCNYQFIDKNKIEITLCRNSKAELEGTYELVQDYLENITLTSSQTVIEIKQYNINLYRRR